MIDLLMVGLKYLLGLLCIGLVIQVHELGHYIVARLSGITVEVFSFGFGPKVFGIQHRDCEFRFSLLPFGGYCRLKGADDLSSALRSRSSRFNNIEKGSLFDIHPFKKFLTYLAGPGANFLLALVLSMIFLSMDYSVLSFEPRIATSSDYPVLFSNESAAYRAGIRKNDVILSVNNIAIEDYQMLERVLSSLDVKMAQIEVLRGSERIVFDVMPEDVDGRPRFGMSCIQSPLVDNVRILSDEYRGGLREGDMIISVDGRKVENNLDLITGLRIADDIIDMEVLRDEEIMDVSFAKKDTYTFSLHGDTRTVKGLGFSESLRGSLINCFRLFHDTFHSLLNIFNVDREGVRNIVTGPMRAAYMVGNISSLGLSTRVDAGFRSLVYLLMIVSISIAIGNLLPLPALDGGQMVVALIETVLHKRVSPRMYWVLQIIGIIGIMAIMAFMYYVDFAHLYNLYRYR